MGSPNPSFNTCAENAWVDTNRQTDITYKVKRKPLFYANSLCLI